MAKTFCVLLCASVIFQTVWCQDGKTCNTVDGGVGRCITIYNCQPYLKLAQEATAESVQILRKAHCGFEDDKPKVCCPTSTTTPSPTTTATPVMGEIVGGLPDLPAQGVNDPTARPVIGVVNTNLGETCKTVDGGAGNCVSLFSCQPYLKMSQQPTPEDTEILRKAHCGFLGSGTPKVCCRLSDLPPAPPQITIPTTTTEPASAASKKALSGFLEALPDPPVCGVNSASFGRVVGGENAKLGDFPWMALLGYKNRFGDTDWLCGGSLISSHHILTAAHCIHNHENDLHMVRLGELDLAREDEGATPIDVQIKQMILHADYNASAHTNDIGILILDKEVEFTELIRPICIPKNSELRSKTYENYTPLIAGWGKIKFNFTAGPTATHLQVAQLPVVSNDFCRLAYIMNKEQKIDEQVICAGYNVGGKDACQGDGGGPLMQPITTPAQFKTYFFQIGIVASGRTCADAGFPGVYSRITHFLPWIEQQVLGRVTV